MPDRGLRERAIGALVVREGGLPLAAVVVDLAEREVEVAMDVPVRVATVDRGADALLVLVVLRGETL